MHPSNTNNTTNNTRDDLRATPNPKTRGGTSSSSSSSLTPAFERLSHRDVDSQQRQELHGNEGGSNNNVRRSSRILLQESSRRAQTQSQQKNSSSSSTTTNSNNKKKTSTLTTTGLVGIGNQKRRPSRVNMKTSHMDPNGNESNLEYDDTDTGVIEEMDGQTHQRKKKESAEQNPHSAGGYNQSEDIEIMEYDDMNMNMDHIHNNPNNPTTMTSERNNDRAHYDKHDQICETMYRLATRALDRRTPSTAIYYAEKLVTLSGGLHSYVLLLAKGYYDLQQYQRVVQLLLQYNLLGKHKIQNEYLKRLINQKQNSRSSSSSLQQHQQQNINNSVEANLHFASSIRSNNNNYNNLTEEEVDIFLNGEIYKKTYLQAYLLSVQSLFALENYDQCLSYLEEIFPVEDDDIEEEVSKGMDTICDCARNNFNSAVEDDKRNEEIDECISLIAALCCLRGKVYEFQDKRFCALIWLKTSLSINMYESEALEFLIDKKLLSPIEEGEWNHHILPDICDVDVENTPIPIPNPDLTTLTSSSNMEVSEHHGHGLQKEKEETNVNVTEERILANQLAQVVDQNSNGWLYLLYSIRLNLYDITSSSYRFTFLEGHPYLGKLYDNGQIRAAQAECYYNSHQYAKALKYSKELFMEDPHHQENILTIYICCLVELDCRSDLFVVAQKLVDQRPKTGLAWFAVGSYYYLTCKYDAAQRFFHKATKMNPRFAVAWIGFGNALSVQDECDQAVSAYRTAFRLFPSCHLASVYIAMEYTRTNNLTLAIEFLQKSLSLCDKDPLTYNELGVVYYRFGDYKSAAESFSKALNLITKSLAPSMLERWESTYVNLGHCLRKLGKFEDALTQFHQALSLGGSNMITYSSVCCSGIAFTYHMMGELDIAIEYYHRALALKGDDTVSSELLSQCLTEALRRNGKLAKSIFDKNANGKEFVNQPVYVFNNPNKQQSKNMDTTMELGE